MPDISEYVMLGTRYTLPVLALWVLMRCIGSMLREKYEPETWAWLTYPDGARRTINHWECIIGRSNLSDVKLSEPEVSRVHAALQRDAAGEWTLSDLRSRGGTFINGEEIDQLATVENGDTFSFAGDELDFHIVGAHERLRLEKGRTAPGHFIGPGVTLLVLTLFQAFLTLEFTVTADSQYLQAICMGFLALMVTQWFCYLLMRSIRRTGFEAETIAFFLTTLGMSIAASSTPEDMFKQTVLMLIGVVLFFILGWWLRDLRRVKAVRLLAAVAAIGLLSLNLLASEAVFGAKNWLTIAGISLQPSELVKVVYIYTGSATLDRLFERRNLFAFITFSAICVIVFSL